MSDDLVKQLEKALEQSEQREAQLNDRVSALEDTLYFNDANLEAAEQRGYANAMEAERKLHEDRIEELEALYEAAKHDAQEAEAYAEALEAKLYDIAQDELKGQSCGPWPNAIRAVNFNYRIEDGSTVWAHRIEQYHDGRWAAIPVYEESEDGTLKEEDR